MTIDLGLPVGELARAIAERSAALPEAAARALLHSPRRKRRAVLHLMRDRLLYLVSPEGELIDDLRLRTLTMAHPDQSVGSLLEGDCPSIREDAPAVDAIRFLRLRGHHHLIALTVGKALVRVVT